MESTTTTTTEAIVNVSHEHGLHARPADLFVRCASSFQSTIHVYNQTHNPARKANAKSILGVLSIGVHTGEQVRIVASGPDSSEAVAALSRLIETNFEE